MMNSHDTASSPLAKFEYLLTIVTRPAWLWYNARSVMVASVEPSTWEPMYIGTCRNEVCLLWWIGEYLYYVLIVKHEAVAHMSPWKSAWNRKGNGDSWIEMCTWHMPQGVYHGHNCHCPYHRYTNHWNMGRVVDDERSTPCEYNNIGTYELCDHLYTKL